ncbi:MAG: cysteine--tRNA ligase [Planctomycetota bacterium]|nr:cysteine--tRNA ligase [Planctomycetota bacterium]
MTEVKEMKLYNALTRKEEVLKTLEAGKVSFYSCGPTVYNVVHIGNLRAFVFYDLLRRSLEFLGYEVRHVMNITDVDDKTIRRSQEQGKTLREFTDFYSERFLDDLAALKIKLPEVMPRATETIDGMKAMIQQLLDKGLAYKSEDGSTYFAINRYKDYGKLIDFDAAELKAGAGGRVAADEYDKESVADFALWKAYVEADGDVFWESEFGKGRPGWHLECSAMAREHLGETIDLHAGGIDLLFPHHENEIAQSEGCSGKPFANHFSHNAHLLVAGKKMSKSLGNFYTLTQLAEDELIQATGRELRLSLMRIHYRRSLNFQVTYGEQSDPDVAPPVLRYDTLEDARASLARFDAFVADVKAATDQGAAEVTADVSAWLETAKDEFAKNLQADLNISGAVAVLFQLVQEGHKRALEGGNAKAVLETLAAFDTVLEILPEEDGLPGTLEPLLAERIEARNAKNWARSDEIRDIFKDAGYELKDGPKGQVWRKL